jgi:putative cell wall binding repeat-containing protein
VKGKNIMKKNLKTLVTMGAIAFSLSAGFIPTLTTHAEIVKDAAYYEHWAHDFTDARDVNGIYVAANVASKITMGRWTDDIRQLEVGNTFRSNGYSMYTYTRNADGKIQIINPTAEENWKIAEADGWTLDEFVNDIVGEIEAYDNQYSHTYVPVTQKMVTGKGFMKTAHYDKVRTDNDPQKVWKEFSQTNGIDTSIPDPDVNATSNSSHSNSSSSGGGSGSSGSGSGSSSSHKSKSNSGSLTGWVSTSDGWMYQIDGNDTTGWVNANGTWYFMNGSGIMQTGWVLSNGKWYYMNANGSMATNWVNAGGKWYFLNSAGDMATGWVLTGGKWYYLDNDGHMLSNTTVGAYRLDASGAWIQ